VTEGIIDKEVAFVTHHDIPCHCGTLTIPQLLVGGSNGGGGGGCYVSQQHHMGQREKRERRGAEREREKRDGRHTCSK